MAAPHPLLLPLLRDDALPTDVSVDETVAYSATEHYVGALIDEVAERRGLPVTDGARRRLSMDRLAAEAEHDAAAATLGRLLDASAAAGVRIAVFKGIAWATRWYHDPRLRPSIDVDAAVHPDDLDRIGDLLRALDADEGTAELAHAMVTEGRVFELSIGDGPSTIDLHRDPANLVVPIRALDELWRPAERDYVVTSAGPVETFDLEWSVLIGFLHGLRDNFADLLHINDLRLMIDDDVDWERAGRLAESEGWTDLVRFAAAFVADVLEIDSPLPRRVRRSAKVAFGALWPTGLLLQGSVSVQRSHRRQSALSLLVRGRTPELAGAYASRVLPPRAVIDQRSGLVDDAPYPVALVRWRASQRRRLRDDPGGTS